MSDLERVLNEAQQAREAAEAAAQRAAELEAQAQTAQEQARVQEGERRRTWARQVADTYDADISAAELKIQEAEARFSQAVLQDLASAVTAYSAWGDAVVDHFSLQLRVAAAAPLLDLDVTPPEFVAPPLFSNALDLAFAVAMNARAEAAKEAVKREVAGYISDTAEYP